MEVKYEPRSSIDCQQGLLKAVRFNADGQYAMSCGSDRTIKLWRPSRSLMLNCYRGHSAEVVDCKANHDSSHLVSCSNDKSIILWDVESGKILRRFRSLTPFTSICFGKGSTTAFASSAEGAVRIYDLRTLNAWDPIQTLTEATESVTCCQVHEERVVTTSLDKKIRTYDIRFGSLTIDDVQRALNHIAIDQTGGSYLVTCLRSNTILVDRKNGKISRQFEGNENKLFKIESAFVLNDSCVASGSEDAILYIWEAASGIVKYKLVHPKMNPPVIHSISCDSLDLILTSCGSSMFMWSL